MLKIESLKSYQIPKYPQGIYYKYHYTFPVKLTGGVASLAALTLLMSSCQPLGVAGPPPVPVAMVTEKEARTIIDEVFAKNGITLEAEFPFTFFPSGQSPVNLELDGYNRDLNIGYEYVSANDSATFTPAVRKELERINSLNNGGPYIKTIGLSQYYDKGPSEAFAALESEIQDFITDLRSRGII